jgi:NAD(P)H-flavin reductase
VSGERPRALAPFERRLLTVTANERLGAYRVLKADDPGGPPVAGQFAMLAAAERWGGGEDERPFLPRAFSYAHWLAGRSEVPPTSDRRGSRRVPRMGYRSPIGGEAHFLLEVVGPGTHRLGELQPGESLWALGPLGVGFEAPREGRAAVLVGGGVGIAPLAIWQDQLTTRPDAPAVAVLLGFRDAAHAEGAALLANAILATDDGAVGHHGRVTDLLEAELDRDGHATVYACGPPPMLEAVRALCAARGVRAQLALESGMACGFGACFGCVVPTRSGYARLCVDGPVLDAAELERVEYAGGHTYDSSSQPALEGSP